METYVELNRPEGIGEVSPATNLVGNIFSGHWHLRSISCHILASSKEAVMLLTLVRVMDNGEVMAVGDEDGGVGGSYGTRVPLILGFCRCSGR